MNNFNYINRLSNLSWSYAENNKNGVINPMPQLSNPSSHHHIITSSHHHIITSLHHHISQLASRNSSTTLQLKMPKFFFSSLPSTSLRMTKVEKFLSLSVLNSWFSYLTSHLSPLISSTLRFYDFTTSRFYDFTISPIHDSLIHNLQFHKFTIHNSQFTLDT